MKRFEYCMLILKGNSGAEDLEENWIQNALFGGWSQPFIWLQMMLGFVRDEAERCVAMTICTWPNDWLRPWSWPNYWGSSSPTLACWQHSTSNPPTLRLRANASSICQSGEMARAAAGVWYCGWPTRRVRFRILFRRQWWRSAIFFMKLKKVMNKKW